MKKKIIQCVETGIVYESVKEASIALNINVKSITMCVNGKRKKAGGYTFITYSNIVTDDSNNKGNANNSNMVTDDSNNKGNIEFEYLGYLLLVFQAFAAYRNNALKMREEYISLKIEYEELKSHPQSNKSNDELQAEFDKILEEKRAKFENLVHLYKNVCNERDGLSDRIQTIISAPEYKPFRNRERQEANEKAKKDKEEWNIIDDTDDEFSAFGTFPERKQTQKHYDDDIGF